MSARRVNKRNYPRLAGRRHGVAVLMSLALAVLLGMGGCAIPLPPHYLDNGCVIRGDFGGTLHFDCPPGEAVLIVQLPSGRVVEARPVKLEMIIPRCSPLEDHSDGKGPECAPRRWRR